MTQQGKGSNRRPEKEPGKYRKEFEKIFEKKKPKPPEKKSHA